MKKFIFILFLLATFWMVACRTHRPFRTSQVVIYPSFDLENFSGFIDPTLGTPYPGISIDSQRVYSPDYNYYFEYQSFKDRSRRKAILYDKQRNPISTLKHLPKGESLIWLDNCVILDGASGPKTEKIVINLTTGKVKTYPTNDWFMFLGQTNESAFFASNSDNNEIEGNIIKKRHSIISINENGVSIVLDNYDVGKSYPDSVYFYEYYNSNFTIRCLKLKNRMDEEKPLKIDFISQGKVVHNLESIPFFYAYTDSYFSTGFIYLNINGVEIYKVSDTSFEKIFDFTEIDLKGWIREFKIEGDYLIFKTQNDAMRVNDLNQSEDSLFTVNGLHTKENVYGYNIIGIVNLKTKECTFPRVR